MTQQSDIAATVHNGVHDERNVVSSLLERDNSMARKGCRPVATTERVLGFTPTCLLFAHRIPPCTGKGKAGGEAI